MKERDAAWREKRLRYLLESEPSEEAGYAKFEKEFPGKAPKEKDPKPKKGSKNG